MTPHLFGIPKPCPFEWYNSLDPPLYRYWERTDLVIFPFKTAQKWFFRGFHHAAPFYLLQSQLWGILFDRESVRLQTDVLIMMLRWKLIRQQASKHRAVGRNKRRKKKPQHQRLSFFETAVWREASLACVISQQHWRCLYDGEYVTRMCDDGGRVLVLVSNVFRVFVPV